MATARALRGGGGLSLCLASAGVVKTLSIAAFTLVWTHSIEKTDWQEDWRVTPEGLVLTQARVKGSGAAGEWRLCSDGNCRTLSEIFGHPVGANVTTMRVCDP